MNNPYKALILGQLVILGVYNLSCTSFSDVRPQPENLVAAEDETGPVSFVELKPVSGELAANTNIQAAASTVTPNEAVSTCSSSVLTLPKQIRFKILSHHDKYNMLVVDKQNKPVAYIKQKSAAGARFEIYDEHDVLMVIGQQKVNSWGAEIELFNCRHESIGTIKQNVEKSFLSAEASYSVSDENNNLLFQSERKTESSKVITMTGANETEMASLSTVKSGGVVEASVNQQPSGVDALLVISTMKLYADPKM